MKRLVCFMGVVVVLASHRANAADENGARPVTVAVVDSKTGEAVTTFRCEYMIYTAGAREAARSTAGDLQVRDPEGIVKIDAPRTCLIRLRIRADAYTEGHGYPAYSDHVLRRDDAERRIVVKRTRGVTVRGRVIDADTGRPVAGAVVTPMVFKPPLFGPDRNRSVKTDADGRFEVKGVERAARIEVTHPDGGTREIKVRTFPKVPDDPETRLAEIKVRPRKPVPKPPPTPVIEIRGKVLDVEGKPVRHFRVVAFTGRKHSRSERRDFDAEDGTFRIAVENVDEMKRAWIGIRAEGFAMWEKTVDAEGGVAEAIARMTPGATVTGHLKFPPKAARDVRIAVRPKRPLDEWGNNGRYRATYLATRTVAAGADGSFAVPGLTAGTWMIYVTGRGLTPLSRTLEVTGEGLDLGTVELAGTGTITGCVVGPEGKPIAFAPGEVTFGRTYRPPAGSRLPGSDVPFITDEDGRFVVSEVPIGEVEVRVCAQQGDVVGAFMQKVLVKEGDTATVEIVFKRTYRRAWRVLLPPLKPPTTPPRRR